MIVKVEHSGWHALSRRVRGVLVAVGVGAGSLTLGSVMALSTGVVGAQPLPLCGGNQTLHPAPLTCTNSRLIDGTTFTVVLDVNASGVATVTYTLNAPRPADTPIRVRWHEGLSNGPIISEISGVIPAGSTGPVVLSVSASTCGGQIDIKAVFTANGDTRGRVGAPKVSTPNCTTTSTTTTTPTTTTPTTAPTTPPTTPTTTGSTVVTSTTMPPSVSQELVSTTLPRTGSSNHAYNAALVAVVLGSLLVVIAGARRMSEAADRHGRP
jgi:hypothetical protein